LRQQGKLPEAVAAYREALRLQPNYSEAHCNLGGTLSAQGKLPEAVAAFREAIRLQPDLPRRTTTWAMLCALRGHYPRRWPPSGRPSASSQISQGALQLGRCPASPGEVARGDGCLREAIRLQPNFPERTATSATSCGFKGSSPSRWSPYDAVTNSARKTPGWRYPSAQWVGERRAPGSPGEKLAAIRRGQAVPADDAERSA